MDKSESLVSIIVPVYKVEKYLPRCIDSLINQTYKNIEIILVDDGSPDNSPKLCDEYASKDSRIRVIHKENAGVSEARNTGIDNAKGDYICFVDSDDYVSENYVKLLMDKQCEAGAEIVWGKMFNEYNNDVSIKNENLSDLIDNRNLSLFFAEHGNVMGGTCRLLIHRNVFKVVKFEKKLKYCEDLYFILNLFKYNFKMAYIDEAIYYYVYNPQSVTNMYTSETCYNYANAKLKCADLLKDMVAPTLIEGIKYDIYVRACLQKCYINDKKVVGDFIQFNTRKNYISYKKYYSSLRYRVKAFLCRHKMYGILKIICRYKQKH